MLSKEIILEKTDRGLDVFKHYLSVPFRIGRNFLNPLYKDGKASCNIYLDKRNNTYKIKDFGNVGYDGDCFFLVGKIYGLNCSVPGDFVKILETINNDLNLSGETIHTNNISRSSEKKELSCSYVQKKFTGSELDFWKSSGINEQILQQFHIVSLQEYRSINSEGKPFTLNSTEKEPMFGYLKGNSIKIYRPLSNLRFLYGGKNTNEIYCFGLEQLPETGDILFITGGEKDVMTLFAHDYNAICFNSETATIPNDYIIKLIKRFQHLIILYDVDPTGQEAANKVFEQFKTYGIKKLLLPLSGTKREKDISNFFELGHLKKEFDDLIKDCLQDRKNNHDTIQLNINLNINLNLNGRIF